MVNGLEEKEEEEEDDSAGFFLSGGIFPKRERRDTIRRLGESWKGHLAWATFYLGFGKRKQGGNWIWQLSLSHIFAIKKLLFVCYREEPKYPSHVFLKKTFQKRNYNILRCPWLDIISPGQKSENGNYSINGNQTCTRLPINFFRGSDKSERKKVKSSIRNDHFPLSRLNARGVTPPERDLNHELYVVETLEANRQFVFSGSHFPR